MSDSVWLEFDVKTVWVISVENGLKRTGVATVCYWNDLGVKGWRPKDWWSQWWYRMWWAPLCPARLPFNPPMPQLLCVLATNSSELSAPSSLHICSIAKLWTMPTIQAPSRSQWMTGWSLPLFLSYKKMVNKRARFTWTSESLSY